MVQVGHLPWHLLVGSLTVAILALDLALSHMLRLLVISQLLGAEAEEMCVLIVYIGSTV